MSPAPCRWLCRRTDAIRLSFAAYRYRLRAFQKNRIMARRIITRNCISSVFSCWSHWLCSPPSRRRKPMAAARPTGRADGSPAQAATLTVSVENIRSASAPPAPSPGTKQRGAEAKGLRLADVLVPEGDPVMRARSARSRCNGHTPEWPGRHRSGLSADDSVAVSGAAAYLFRIDGINP
jgi:hypothetical protein